MKDTNPWFNGTYDDIDFRRELAKLGIVEDTKMTTQEEQFEKTLPDAYNQLFGTDELVDRLQAVFAKWCKDNNYRGTLERAENLEMSDIPKEGQFATKPSTAHFWTSSLLMFFYKSKDEGYYFYSLTDKKSNEILAKDFPELYSLLIKDGNLAELPFSDNY